jgi:restriction system protein
MADVTRRRTGEFVRKLFEILARSPDGLPAREALRRLADSLTLTEYEAGVYESSGTQRFDKIVRFATIDCVKAGWLIKHRGTWTVTDAGLAAYKKYPEPEDLYREAVRLYREWRANQPIREAQAESDEPIEDAGSEKSASITFEQADEQAWGEIERHLRSMNPFEFQGLVGDLLKAMGYYVSWIAPPGKDGGVDLIAYTDPLGTRAPRIKVQVKRLGQAINSDGLKAFIALINEDDVGIFVSVAGFTKDAQDFARGQERRKVTLLDLDRLVDLWIEFYSRLDESARQRLRLTPIHFLTPST